MKKTVCLLLLFCLSLVAARAGDTVFVKETQIPILIDRKDNVLYQLRIDAQQSKVLDHIQLTFDPSVNLSEIESVKLYYAGTEAYQSVKPERFAPVTYISRDLPGRTLAANLSYSDLKSEMKQPQRDVVLEGNQPLFPGTNYFWVSLQMKPTASLLSKIKLTVPEVSVDGRPARTEFTQSGSTHYLGVGVRHAGDDAVAAYRIPGLVTTNAGTLLGVYDIRYNTSVDLQEHVDIGISRSTDKGQTWEPMRTAMTFGNYGGLPKAQNGVGDPSILVDEKTGTVWVVAAWTHGMGNQRAWWSSYPGMDIHHTAQLMLTKSDDDGKTWSEPINITEQVKDPSWYFLLQGPGRGISMQDGTLVFPIQFIDSTRVPNAGVMYSKDHGKTWNLHNLARTNTTEAQVAEVEPGVLMLNMRDNRGGSRAVSTTRDLGKTWTEHPSNRSALPESVCMASLIEVDAKDNVTGKKLLLFSNPNVIKGRNHITIKASTDGGLTWPDKYQIMLDEEEGWGYSCLSMIDDETVGIFYESSVAHMTFQAVKLKDLIKE